MWTQVQEEKLRVPEKMDDIDRVDTPDSGNAPDAIGSSLADDSVSQVWKKLYADCIYLGLAI